MATFDFIQTDSAATFNVGCSGATAGVTTEGRTATVAGPAGSTADLDFDPGTGTGDALRACNAFLCDKPGVASWASGTAYRSDRLRSASAAPHPSSR